MKKLQLRFTMQIGLSEGIKPMAKFEKFKFIIFIKINEIYKFLRKEWLELFLLKMKFISFYSSVKNC